MNQATRELVFLHHQAFMVSVHTQSCVYIIMHNNINTPPSLVTILDIKLCHPMLEFIFKCLYGEVQLRFLA